MSVIRPEMTTPVDPQRYDKDYYENGPILGISGYMNYSWMPELTLRMAHKLIMALPIQPGDRVLDFGCAKGFLVKAMRILDITAFGVDISAYAIAHADGEVREYCRCITGASDATIFDGDYEWMIAKDVFEHLVEDELIALLTLARVRVRRLFAVVPLASDDHTGKYIIAEYDRDVTHKLAKSMAWWRSAFERCGWNVQVAAHCFPGCKENWTNVSADGNGFFVVERS